MTQLFYPVNDVIAISQSDNFPNQPPDTYEKENNKTHAQIHRQPVAGAVGLLDCPGRLSPQ